LSDPPQDLRGQKQGAGKRRSAKEFRTRNGDHEAELEQLLNALPRTSQLTTIDDNQNLIRRPRQDLRSRRDGQAGTAGFGCLETMQQNAPSHLDRGAGTEARLRIDIGGATQIALGIANFDRLNGNVRVVPAVQRTTRAAILAEWGGIEEMCASRCAQDAASGFGGRNDDVGEPIAKNALGDS